MPTADANEQKKPVVKLLETAKGLAEYSEYGQGPVVVSIHGAMGGYDQSLILAKTVLTGDFRVIAISRPGYLGTPLASGASPEAQADLLAALLDALAIPAAIVIAISGGGPTAIQFALRHPQRCQSLVLVSTVSCPNTYKVPGRFQMLKFMAQLPGLPTLLRKSTLKNMEKSMQRSVSDLSLLQQLKANQECGALFQALILSTFEQMGKRIQGSENDFHNTQTGVYPLEAVQVPTLIVHGTNDPLVNFEEHALTAQQRIPGAELLVLEHGEHAAIFTHCALVRAKVAAFLKTFQTNPQVPSP